MKYLLILTLIITTNAFSKSGKVKSLSRDEKILLLIKKEEDTINSVKNKPIRLYYRFFELQNEKLKIIAKKENEKFIKQKSTQRNIFFKKTKEQYFYLKKLAYGLYKYKTNSNYIAPTFHALSLSCRDYKFEDKELKYINIALNKAKQGTELKYNILVSKAEYLYNAKEYRLAYKIYKRIIKNDEDQWYTKNLYNYGWTQFKTHRFDESINSLERAYILSKQKRYIDFTEQVMNSLITFYISHNKINTAIKFILKNDTDSSINSLFKLARKASKKGFYDDTNTVIRLLNKKIFSLKDIKLAEGQKNPYLEKIIELRIFEIEHFREFNKKDLFFITVNKLQKFKLDDVQKEETVNYLTTEVSDLQQILKKAYNEENKSYDKKILKYCLYYFKVLRKYNGKEKYQYFFYAAETLFSVNEHKRSIAYYKSSISKDDQFKLNKRSIDALYIAIEEAKLSKKEYFKNLEYVYSTVIKLWPTEASTKTVITKLFNLYLTLKKHKKMKVTLYLFKKNFPNNQVEQRLLFEKQLDLLIKQKNTKLLSNKLKSIKSGFLSFSKERIVQVEDILSTILFNKFKNLRINGDNEGALKGYNTVYLKKDLPKKIKSQAALNIAIIHTDLYDSNNTLRWINRSFKQDKQTYFKNIDVFLALADRTLFLHDFLGASNLYRYYLKHSCSKLEKNKDIVAKLISANMANTYTRKVLHFFKKYKKCISKDNQDLLQKEIISYLMDENDYTNVISLLDTSIYGDEDQFSILEELYWRNNKSNATLKKIKVNNSNQAKTFLSARNIITSLKIREKELKENKLLFPKEMKPEIFNKKLNDYFNNISLMLDDSKKVIDLKNKFFTKESLEISARVLKVASIKLSNIKSPIKEKVFNDSFYSQMKSLSQGFHQQSTDYKRTLMNFVNEYNLLTNKVIYPILTRAPSSIKTIDLEKK